jgi:hypothetical protein
MKTRYSGYCCEHKNDREFSGVLSSSMKPFLVSSTIMFELALAASLLHL